MPPSCPTPTTLLEVLNTSETPPRVPEEQDSRKSACLAHSWPGLHLSLISCHHHWCDQWGWQITREPCLLGALLHEPGAVQLNSLLAWCKHSYVLFSGSNRWRNRLVSSNNSVRLIKATFSSPNLQRPDCTTSPWREMSWELVKKVPHALRAKHGTKCPVKCGLIGILYLDKLRACNIPKHESGILRLLDCTGQ